MDFGQLMPEEAFTIQAERKCFVVFSMLKTGWIVFGLLSFGCLVGCLVVWLVAWLVAWLVGCLVAWLVGWLLGWLVACLVGFPALRKSSFGSLYLKRQGSEWNL